jgi:hypothetical protein
MGYTPPKLIKARGDPRTQACTNQSKRKTNLEGQQQEPHWEGCIGKHQSDWIGANRPQPERETGSHPWTPVWTTAKSQWPKCLQCYRPKKECSGQGTTTPVEACLAHHPCCHLALLTKGEETEGEEGAANWRVAAKVPPGGTTTATVATKMGRAGAKAPMIMKGAAEDKTIAVARATAGVLEEMTKTNRIEGSPTKDRTGMTAEAFKTGAMAETTPTWPHKLSKWQWHLRFFLLQYAD